VSISGKYLSLESYRHDGTPVSTPVWFVVDKAGRYLVMTDRDSYKVRRIRANPAVTLAGCNARGRRHGPTVPGRAEVLPETDTEAGVARIKSKYRTDMLVIGPLRWLQQALHLGGSSGPSVIVAVTPT